MRPSMRIVGPFLGVAGSVETAASRNVAAADLGDHNSGNFYATANRKKLVGPTSIQTWPDYLTDEPSKDAGSDAVVNLTKVLFPE